MFGNIEESLELIGNIITFWFVVQISFSIVILFLGNTMLEFYALGRVDPPRNKFHKVVNFLAAFMYGIGPYIYQKLLKYSWIKRKLFMLLAVIGMILGSLIVYFIFSSLFSSSF